MGTPTSFFPVGCKPRSMQSSSLCFSHTSHSASVVHTPYTPTHIPHISAHARACACTHTHPYTYTYTHNSSAFLHTGHWNVFLAQTPEPKVMTSSDKMTKTL